MGAAKFSAGFIAERLQKKYEMQLNKELQRYIANIDKKNYISKARFDKEFIIYQELSEKILDMVANNVRLFLRIDALPEAKDEQQKVFNERHENAVQSYNEANRTIYANAPFIPKEFYDLFCDIKNKCHTQIIDYGIFKLDTMSDVMRTELRKEYHICFNRTEEINSDMDKIISDVRNYLTSLDVFNYKE
jgi:hypothetical protein